jgi:hypothetical protein
MRLVGMMAVAGALAMAADRDQNMSGWVSDAGCGAKHTQTLAFAPSLE